MKTRFALSAVCLIAVATLSSPQVANAQCTTGSLFGVYGFNRVGVMTDNPLPPYSIFGISIFASVGQFVADGAGHFTSLTQTISTNGVVYRNDQVFAPRALSYTVNSDCTGTLTIRSSILPRAVDYDFVFEAGNTVLRLVASDQSNNAFGTAVLESPTPFASCPLGNATLASPFGASMFGIFFSSTATPPLNIVSAEGRVNFDGLGGLSYQHLTADNDFFATRWIASGKGKYTVSGDCTGTTTIPGNVFPNFDFVLVNNNNQLLFMNTDNTLSFSIGEMTAQ